MHRLSAARPRHQEDRSGKPRLPPESGLDIATTLDTDHLSDHSQEVSVSARSVEHHANLSTTGRCGSSSTRNGNAGPNAHHRRCKLVTSSSDATKRGQDTIDEALTGHVTGFIHHLRRTLDLERLTDPSNQRLSDVVHRLVDVLLLGQKSRKESLTGHLPRVIQKVRSTGAESRRRLIDLSLSGIDGLERAGIGRQNRPAEFVALLGTSFDDLTEQTLADSSLGESLDDGGEILDDL